MMATDYTAFESHFTESLLTICEFRLYSYMTRHLPTHVQFMRDLLVLTGKNAVYFRDVKCEIKARRMSGEMNTSLGNSFANLMLFFYVHRNNAFCDAIVEGDDCIGAYVGTTPTKEQYAELGLTVKIETPNLFSEASFCGQIFTDDYDVITDPHKIIVKTGWINANYLNSKLKKKMELLRCRAMSILSMYPACPIVTAFGSYLLRVTTGYHFYVDRGLTPYERKKLSLLCENFQSRVRMPTMPCRRLMEGVFKFSVVEQIHLEKYFDELTCVQPIDHPLLFAHATGEQINYFLKYCFDTPQPELGGQINAIFSEPISSLNVERNENEQAKKESDCCPTLASAASTATSVQPVTTQIAAPAHAWVVAGLGHSRRTSFGRATGRCNRRGSGSDAVHNYGVRGVQVEFQHIVHGANGPVLPSKHRWGRNLPP
jgi:hypothetical protein